MLSKLKKILGVITDMLLIGRKAGWWKKGQDFPVPNKYYDKYRKEEKK